MLKVVTTVIFALSMGGALAYAGEDVASMDLENKGYIWACKKENSCERR